jgi:hypothetical protein
MAMGITPGLPAAEIDAQALSDAAIGKRIDLALAALRPATTAARAPVARLRTTRSPHA